MRVLWAMPEARGLAGSDYRQLCDAVRARSGLALRPDMQPAVEARLKPLHRHFDLPALIDLVALTVHGVEPVASAVVEALVNTETRFFRDRMPFIRLRDVILPTLVARGQRRLRIWSAGCGSGQEAWSMAMLLAGTQTLREDAVEVVATDLSASLLRRAQGGLYSQTEIQLGLPARLLVRHFTKHEAAWRVSDDLRRHVTFRHHNLMEPAPQGELFDIILGRNVLRDIDPALRANVLRRLAAACADGGVVILGSGEGALIDADPRLTADNADGDLLWRRGESRPAAATVITLASRRGALTGSRAG